MRERILSPRRFRFVAGCVVPVNAGSIGVRHPPLKWCGHSASKTRVTALLASAFSFLFPHNVRERSAGTAQANIWHLWRCRVPLLPGTPASRRSTATIFYTASALLGLDRRDFPSRYPGSIGAAVHPDPS